MKSIDEKIIDRLLQAEYVSARDLSKEFHYNEKTVRQYIHSLDEFLRANGAEIVSQRGKGYHLIIHDEKTFTLSREIRRPSSAKSQGNVENRIGYIVAYLLIQNRPVDIMDLCDVLNISDSTLIGDLKVVKKERL